MALIEPRFTRLVEALARLRLSAGAGVRLAELSRVLAEAFGDRPALRSVEPRRAWTFAQLEDDVARLAAAHCGSGMAHRRVAVLCQNRLEIALHALALARAGAVALPLNQRLGLDELADSIEAAGATALVADRGEQSPGGLHRPDLAGWLLAHPQRRLRHFEHADPTAPALLLATSGTTGRPKIARLSGRALLGGVGRLHAFAALLARFPRGGRQLVLEALPLSHAMGLCTVLGALCAGAEVLHLDRFDAKRILALIESERPNVFVGVPTMFADLEAAGAEGRDLRSIQLWISAADAMPAERARRFQRLGALQTARGRTLLTAAFADVYGMVELGGPAAVRFFPAAPPGLELPAVGRLLPGIEARAADEAGQPLGWGAAGELQIRGPRLFDGYENDRPAERDGWFSTGDRARLWPFGFFQLAGRAGDRIKVGGFSVFPEELEAVLRAHPAVTEVAVIGAPDARLGARLVALVVPRTPGADARALLGWARERLGGYRRPARVLFVERLPRGPNGKLDRRAAARMERELGSGARPAGSGWPARKIPDGAAPAGSRSGRNQTCNPSCECPSATESMPAGSSRSC